MKACGNCEHFARWCDNVYICKIKKDTVDKKKIGTENRCQQWRKKK